jgi:hypothetical protein
MKYTRMLKKMATGQKWVLEYAREREQKLPKDISELLIPDMHGCEKQKWTPNY